MLIINADDWGRSKAATDSAIVCYQNGRISSTTAMVFMEDSTRAAQLARDIKIDVGLHLNLSEDFTCLHVPDELRKAHTAIRRFLKANRYALVFYNPFLRQQFSLVLRAQTNEFARLYGKPPSHIDGHQHMHLCSNVLFDQLISTGTKVRRSFSFQRGEKSFVNRIYRSLVDRHLLKRHRITDYFFALSSNLSRERLKMLVRLATQHSVELMTHTELARERECLLGDEFAKLIASAPLGNYSLL
jgi:chitin disaccharide deacetylase